jgi:hypothetical protein
MWHMATYEPVSLISLKLATATSTGGKSVLLPTPYAFKMALLNMIIQDAGLDTGKAIWETLRDAHVAVRGPEWITVNNTFTKILKPMKDKPSLDPETGLTRSMITTIGFREYVQWQREIQIALRVKENTEPWGRWLTQINYIGKRGGFIQTTREPTSVETLDAGFVNLSEPVVGFDLNGTMQIMDDCAQKLTFDQVDIYSEKRVERVFRHVAIPYRLVSSSRGYTLYRRLD